MQIEILIMSFLLCIHNQFVYYDHRLINHKGKFMHELVRKFCSNSVLLEPTLILAKIYILLLTRPPLTFDTFINRVAGFGLLPQMGFQKCIKVFFLNISFLSTLTF